MAARQSLGERLLLLILTVGAASLQAEVKEVRRYRTHEPRDPKVLFAMAVTPNGDALSFVAKKDGKWRLTRVRNWLDKNPVDETIDVPGIGLSLQSKDSSNVLILADLLATPDGRFAVGVATTGRGKEIEHIV